MVAIAKSSSQIELSHTCDNILFFKDGTGVLAISLMPINFNTLDESQQDNIFANYEQFLNSLEAEIQILTSLRQADDQTASRQFYLILRTKTTQLSLTKKKLQEQANHLKTNLTSLNLQPKILSNQESLRLLKSHYNFNNNNLCDDDFKNQISYQQLIHQPRHLKINNTYFRVCEINDYPASSDYNFMHNILNNKFNLNLSYFIKPVDTDLALEKLKRKIAELQSRQTYLIKRGQIVSPEIDNPLKSALELETKLSRQETKLFQVNILILIIADSIKELNLIQNSLQTQLKSKLFNLSLNAYQQLASFEACLPQKHTKFHRYFRNFDSQSLSISFPFKDGQIQQAKGIIYGKNQFSSAIIKLNRFNLTNAHSIIIGQSGAGKSYLAKLEIIGYLQNKVDIIVIDPENEYTKLAKAQGGKVINISEQKIDFNPLNITENYQANINTIIDLIEIMAHRLSYDQRDCLDKLLLSLYQKNSRPN